jgi:hypothetical protein
MLRLTSRIDGKRLLVSVLAFGGVLGILVQCGHPIQQFEPGPNATDARVSPPKPKDAGHDRSVYLYDGTANPEGWEDLPNWEPMANAGECNLRMAREPAKDVIPHHWVPCQNGRACEATLSDWATETGVRILWDDHVRRGADGKLYFNYRRMYPAKWLDPKVFTQMSNVVEEFLGPAVYADMYRPDLTGGIATCSAVIGISEVGMFREVWHTAAVRLDTDRWYAPFTAPTQFVQQEFYQWETFGNPGAVWGSATHLFRFRSQPNNLVVSALPKGAFVQAKRANGKIPWLIDPDPMGDRAFTRDLSSGGYAWVYATGSVIDALPFPTGAYVAAAAIDHDAGNRIYWTTKTASAETLWSAPFAESAAAIVPKHIVDYPAATHSPGAENLVVSHGWVLVRTEDGVFATRAADGASWRIAAEPDHYFNDVLWADETTLVAIDSALMANSYVNQRIFRIKPQDLGAPDF